MKDAKAIYLTFEEASTKYGLAARTIRTYCSKQKVVCSRHGVLEPSLVTYMEGRDRRPMKGVHPIMVRTVDAIPTQMQPAARARFWDNVNAIAFIPNQKER